MADTRKLMAETQRRMDELQAAVFNSPPATFEDFKLRLGQWLGLNETREIIKAVLDQEEADEEGT